MLGVLRNRVKAIVVGAEAVKGESGRGRGERKGG